MKATLNITSNYGFDHNWTLTLTKRDGSSKAFYLGQDVKFCCRVLGIQPRDIVEHIGSNDLSLETTRTKLANFIIDSLGLTKKQLFTNESWALCAQ